MKINWQKRIKQFQQTLLLSALVLQPAGLMVAAESSSEVESDVGIESSELTETPVQPRGEGLTFDQVIQAYEASDKIKLGDKIYEGSQAFSLTQSGYELKVDQFALYEVDKGTTYSDFGYGAADELAGLLIVKASIHNLSPDSIYYSIESLKMSHADAEVQISPNRKLYLGDQGNLRSDLEDTDGLLASDAQAEGYIVYGLSQEGMDSLQDEDSFYLTAVPPRKSLDEIAGMGTSDLGHEMNFYLPLNDETQEELKLKESYIQDRVTTEWWGHKEIMAAEDLNQTEADREVEVKLLRYEVSEFEPNASYENAFQNFTQGTVLLSVEYEVLNHSKQAIYPVDSEAQLYINQDNIVSDYVLVNEEYGLEVQPGDSYRLVKTFALDKRYFQENWQDHPIELTVTIPFDATSTLLEEVHSSNTDDEATEEEAEEQKPSINAQLTFQWLPAYHFVFDTDLNHTAPGEMANESDVADASESEDQETDDESQEE